MTILASLLRQEGRVRKWPDNPGEQMGREHAALSRASAPHALRTMKKLGATWPAEKGAGHFLFSRRSAPPWPKPGVWGGFEQKMPPPVAVTGERDGVTDTIQFASLEANSLEPELLRTLARRRLGRP